MNHADRKKNKSFTLQREKKSNLCSIGSMVKFVEWEDALDYHSRVVNGEDTVEPLERFGILIDRKGSSCSVLCGGETMETSNFLVTPVASP